MFVGIVISCHIPSFAHKIPLKIQSTEIPSKPGFSPRHHGPRISAVLPDASLVAVAPSIATDGFCCCSEFTADAENSMAPRAAGSATLKPSPEMLTIRTIQTWKLICFPTNCTHPAVCAAMSASRSSNSCEEHRSWSLPQGRSLRNGFNRFTTHFWSNREWFIAGFTWIYRRIQKAVYSHYLIILRISSIFLSLSQKIGNMSGDWNALECASAIAAALSWTRPPQIWSKSGNDACLYRGTCQTRLGNSARRNPLAFQHGSTKMFEGLECSERKASHATESSFSLAPLFTCLDSLCGWRSAWHRPQVALPRLGHQDAPREIMQLSSDWRWGKKIEVDLWPCDTLELRIVVVMLWIPAALGWPLWWLMMTMSYQKWDQLEKFRKLFTESLDANAHWPGPAMPSYAQPSLSRPVVPTTPLASRSICVAEVRQVSSKDSSPSSQLPGETLPTIFTQLPTVCNCISSKFQMIISDIWLLRNSMDFVTVPASEFPHIGFQRLCGNLRLATNTCRCWAPLKEGNGSGERKIKKTHEDPKVKAREIDLNWWPIKAKMT